MSATAKTIYLGNNRYSATVSVTASSSFWGRFAYRRLNPDGSVDLASWGYAKYWPNGATLKSTYSCVDLRWLSNYQYQFGYHENGGTYHFSSSFTITPPAPQIITLPAGNIGTYNTRLYAKYYGEHSNMVYLRFRWWYETSPGTIKIVTTTGVYLLGSWRTGFGKLYKNASNTKVFFQSYLAGEGPDVYGDILSFTKSSRLYKYRAFGVKPDQSEVYGEWKTFLKPNP